MSQQQRQRSAGGGSVAYRYAPANEEKIGGQAFEAVVSRGGTIRFSTALMGCLILVALVLGTVGVILGGIAFGFWSTHTVPNSIITSNEIYVDSVHSLGEIVGTRYIIQGQPAIRLEPSAFLSGNVMILGSETNDFTRVAAQSIISFYLDDPSIGCFFGPFFSPYWGLGCAPVDFFTGPITQIMTPNIQVIEQLMVMFGAIFISDERLKNNIAALDESDSMAIIRQVIPKSFEFLESETTHAGFIAQELQQQMPEAVTEVGGLQALEPTAQLDNLLAIEPFAIMAHTVNALKNIDRRLQALESALSPPPPTSAPILN